jgi:hypothetical protein
MRRSEDEDERGGVEEWMDEAEDLLDRFNDERRRVSGDGASSSSLFKEKRGERDEEKTQFFS